MEGAADPEGQEANVGPLSPMNELVDRIPSATRELVEELFRGRFVQVKRIPESALKGENT